MASIAAKRLLARVRACGPIAVKPLVVGVIVLGAAACAHSDTPRQFVWHCAGGSSFSVRFEPRGTAVVSAAGERYVLPIARSASGARYSDGAVEFWEHQGEARLNGAAGGPYRGCRIE